MLIECAKVTLDLSLLPLPADRFILCYAENHTAYFTTQALGEQWGDDWDDAPYEHNAGTPYRASLSFSTYDTTKKEWVRGTDYEDGMPKWYIAEARFSANLITPDSAHFNSSYSVQAINGKAVSWLRTDEYHNGGHVHIWAGTTLPDFLAAIQSIGGLVHSVTCAWQEPTPEETPPHA